MCSLDKLELEIKNFIVATLALEDVVAEDIDSNLPLFGDGLGLDSIDALELGVSLQKKYKVKIDPKLEEVRSYFFSVKTLAAFIAKSRDGAESTR